MTPKKMKQLLIGTLVIIIVIAGVAIFFANQKLTAMAEETVRMSADIEVAKKKVTTYAAAKDQVLELSYVGDLANKVLPESQEQSVVVAELSTFATREKLIVSGIEFVEQVKTKKSKDKKSAVPKGVEIVPVIVKFEDAPYDSLINFMKTVEQNQRKMQITSISITPDEEDRSVLSEVAVAFNLYVKSIVEKSDE